MEQKLKVKIKKANFVADWTWEGKEETCGICRQLKDGCCGGASFPGEDCPVVAGKCKHSFHLLCIEQWLNSKGSEGKCPLCRQKFTIQKDDVKPQQ